MSWRSAKRACASRTRSWRSAPRASPCSSSRSCTINGALAERDTQLRDARRESQGLQASLARLQAQLESSAERVRALSAVTAQHNTTESQRKTRAEPPAHRARRTHRRARSGARTAPAPPARAAAEHEGASSQLRSRAAELDGASPGRRAAERAARTLRIAELTRSAPRDGGLGERASEGERQHAPRARQLPAGIAAAEARAPRGRAPRGRGRRGARRRAGAGGCQRDARARARGRPGRRRGVGAPPRVRGAHPQRAHRGTGEVQPAAGAPRSRRRATASPTPTSMRCCAMRCAAARRPRRPAWRCPTGRRGC